MSVQQLIAHFLKENGYPETLEQFEKEHGHPIEPKPDYQESLEAILNDRAIYNDLKNTSGESVHQEIESSLTPALKQLSLNMKGWKMPFPNKLVYQKQLSSLIISSFWHERTKHLLCSSTDQNLYLFNSENWGCTTIKQPLGKEIIKHVFGNKDNLFVAGMNGKIWCADLKNTENGVQFVVNKEIFVQAHARMIIDAQVIEDSQGDVYVITLGWDFHLKVFKKEKNNDSHNLKLFAQVKLSIQGTCFTATKLGGQIYIIVGKLDQTLLDVYNLNLSLIYRISINDAVFSTTGFTPRRIIADKGTLVVATSHEPFMRLIVVGFFGDELEVSEDNDNNNSNNSNNDKNSMIIKRNQIIRNIDTCSPQNKFSQPLINWRSDELQTGVWVAGDDGKIRGFDLQQGKLVIEFESGHESSIKHMTVGIPERIITAGSDKKVKIWGL